VLSRNATAAFKDSAKTPVEIGRELGVRYLLEGSVRKAGSQIRVSARLTDATTGQHLWSNRYDKEFEHLFSIQDDITRNVAGALAVKLIHVERERVSSTPTDKLEAYDYVVRGWDLIRRQSRSAIFRAREMFRRAIEIDPNYASAYAGLGASHQWAVALGYTEFIAKGIESAEKLAQRALALDPDNVEARRLHAFVQIQRGEHDLAADHLRRALEINPSDADSYKDYGIILLWSGHERGAIEWFEAALRLDPNMRAHRMNDLGLAYYLDGRYEDAVVTAQKSLSEGPNYYFGQAIMAAAQAQLGRADKAADAAQQVLQTKPFFTIEWFTAAFPDPDDTAHMADGLKKAGFPLSKPDS
jgi:Tfp pilus assembly protein PilF